MIELNVFCLHVVDVEGQIELLERLVPDWLSKESASTGDLLYRYLWCKTLYWILF